MSSASSSWCRAIQAIFQLPLSGSPAAGEAATAKAATLSTPSLGITAFRQTLQNVNEVQLSTPSLGITFRPPGGGGCSTSSAFQLPLSGSPSPIPGFFGSPRLSAAAPLRTNDF